MTRPRLVTFAGVTIKVIERDPDAGGMIDLVFGRFQESDHGRPCVRLELAQDGLTKFALWRDGSLVYSQKPAASAARLLLAEAVHKYAVNCRSHTLVHAAAVAHEGRGFLLPGVSGVGKSTLAAWLDLNGFACLGDEIIGIGGNGSHLIPFPRPICLEVSARAAVPILLETAGREGRLLEDDDGMMVVPRSSLPPTPVPLVGVIFPRYQEDSDVALVRVSKGAAAMRLMESVVNPDALPGHGFMEIGSLARRVPAFTLRFGALESCADAILRTSVRRDVSLVESL